MFDLSLRPYTEIKLSMEREREREEKKERILSLLTLIDL